MANKLGLTNEVKEIKLGKSFAKNENQSFHTFRYDFMPASVDTTKRANVEIGEGHQVTVTVPHIEGSGTSNTVFKGSKKPYQKECVLIIDHTTGEITLEKLSFNVQLKKTRAEGSSRARTSLPPENITKRSPPVHKLSPQPKPSPAYRSSPRSPVQRSPCQIQPDQRSPCQIQPDQRSPCQIQPDPVLEVPPVGVLSSSSSSDSSSAESSDSSDDDAPPPRPPSMPEVIKESPKKEDIILPSMPKFNQLSEDLQLSESDSEG